MKRPVVSTAKAAAQLAFLGVVAAMLYSCTVKPVERGQATLDGLSGPPVVKVALGKYFPADGNTATVAVEGEYRVLSSSGAVLHHGLALAACAVAPSKSGLTLGGQPFGERDLRISPAFDGTLKVGDRYYRGILRVVASDEGKLLLVNEVPMEAYIAGVVGAEMPLDWPNAALEAQAIAARTYALYEMRQADRDGRGELWHVTDDTRSQVYAGMLRDTEKARAIVDATKGMVLLSGGRVFSAYFHSTCGGATEPADLFFPIPRTAPLSGRPCQYCGNTKWSHWEVEIAKKDIAARLNVKEVSGLRIVESAPGIHGLKIEAGGRSWPALDFRMAVGADRLPSTAFEVEDRGASYVFRGRGYGHGVGLCQSGARGMADLGYESTDILRFYYPGAEVLKVY